MCCGWKVELFQLDGSDEYPKQMLKQMFDHFLESGYIYLTAKETHIFNINFIPEILIKFYPK